MWFFFFFFPSKTTHTSEAGIGLWTTGTTPINLCGHFSHMVIAYGLQEIPLRVLLLQLMSIKHQVGQDFNFLLHIILRALFVTLVALCSLEKHISFNILAKPYHKFLICHFAKRNAIIHEETFRSSLIDETNACARSWEMASMKFKGISDLFKYFYLCLGNFLCHEIRKTLCPKRIRYLDKLSTWEAN